MPQPALGRFYNGMKPRFLSLALRFHGVDFDQFNSIADRRQICRLERTILWRRILGTLNIRPNIDAFCKSGYTIRPYHRPHVPHRPASETCPRTDFRVHQRLALPISPVMRGKRCRRPCGVEDGGSKSEKSIFVMKSITPNYQASPYGRIGQPTAANGSETPICYRLVGCNTLEFSESSYLLFTRGCLKKNTKTIPLRHWISAIRNRI